MKIFSGVRAFVMVAAAMLSFVAAPLVYAESIEAFNVTANLDISRELTIQETIEYDFGTEAHHGILRVLPERYRRWLLVHDLHYTIDEVTIDGQAAPWEKERRGADLVLRIGDPYQTITGKHTYRIQYRTKRALNDVKQSYELYWNVTGNDWPVTIKNPSFVFSGPFVQDKQCFTGRLGSTDNVCSFRETEAAGQWRVYAPLTLNSGEGFTVLLQFPSSSFMLEPLLTTLRYLVQDNWWQLLPFALCLVMVLIWYRWGRDPRGRGVIIPEYEPPAGMTPALMAGLVDQDVSSKAISATLVDLARRGHAKIELVGKEPEDPSQVIFHRQIAPTKDALLPYERALMDAVLEDKDQANLKRTSSQKQWTAYQAVLASLSTELVQRGWFRHKPGVIRAGWLFIGFCITGLAFVSESYTYFVLAVCVALLGWQMPRVTREGAVMVEHVLGFKRFLTVTEQARLAFTDAPAKRPEQFALFLPAAIALGVEKAWAEQFKGMLIAPPDYIQGAGVHWTSLGYVSAMHHVSHMVTASMAHQTRAGSGGSGFSSGGGFSGGGFGGGGGGSW